MLKRMFGILLAIVSLPTLALPLEKLALPEGFAIEVYAENVKNARQMALGDNGTLFVGSRGAGLVHAVVDTNQDGKADKVIVLAKDLNMPSGLTFKDGDLYVSEVSRILRFEDIENNLVENAPRIPVSF